MHRLFNYAKVALFPALSLIGKYRYHFMIWAIMLAYLAFAPDIHAYFTIQQGKPVPLHQNLPRPSLEFQGTLDAISPIDLVYKDVFHAWGWSDGMVAYSADQYERFLVLSSPGQTYFFPLQPAERPDVKEAYPDLNRLHSGYSTYVSKNSVRPGEYAIGILARHRAGPDVYYNQVPLKKIIRTPNRIWLELAH